MLAIRWLVEWPVSIEEWHGNIVAWRVVIWEDIQNCLKKIKINNTGFQFSSLCAYIVATRSCHSALLYLQSFCFQINIYWKLSTLVAHIWMDILVENLIKLKVSETAKCQRLLQISMARSMLKPSVKVPNIENLCCFELTTRWYESPHLISKKSKALHADKFYAFCLVTGTRGIPVNIKWWP